MAVLVGGLQLGIAAILWTNNTGPPLDSQLPWHLFSDLVHMWHLSSDKPITTPAPPSSKHDVALYATALLVTMSGRFFKTAPLDGRHIDIFEQEIMPAIYAHLAHHHDDPDLAGVLVILAALAVGQPYRTHKQHILLSDEGVRKGKLSDGSMQAMHPQCLNSNTVVAGSIETAKLCVEGCIF